MSDIDPETLDLAGVSRELWSNARDSIRHALDHFGELGGQPSSRAHHEKWIVLSVHHAAECLINRILFDVDPKSTLFSRNGRLWFPSLSMSLAELEKPQYAGRLTPAEQELLSLLSQIIDIRHQFMHRTGSRDLDVSIAAMCMMGLLKMIERREGEEVSSIVWQSPPIESDVVAAIRYTRVEEYCRFVELFLREKYPAQRLPECPACGVPAVVGSSCEACFEDLDYVMCPEHGEEAYFMSWERSRGPVDVECPHCGETHRA